MPLFREVLDDWTRSCLSDLNLMLNKYTSSSLPMTFLMGRVFLTIFNKIRDVNKKISLLRKLLHAQSSLGPQTVANLI
jgi:hypothetical protein